jgi:hypothetical protein
VSAGPDGRDGDIEAFVVDRYLESLLARQPIDLDGVPPELDATARRLAGALPRYHPSFRFEERLAARLAAAAGRSSTGEVVAFPGAGPTRGSRGEIADRSFVGRPAVIGGVLTSAAISLAGAAYVAWRRNRSSLTPMTRAARAATRARLI